MIKPTPEEEYEEWQREQHEEGNCPGYPQCGYCCDLRDERQEKDKAEADDWWTKEP